MIEPEIAFADLKDDMKLAEDCLKHVLQYALEHAADDLAFLEKRELDAEKQLPQAERHDQPLRARLQAVVDAPFTHLTYTEAIDLLRNSKPYKKKKFKFPVEWGVDLQSEHERWLVEKHVGWTGHRDRLPGGHQGLLHARQRGRQNRGGDGRVGAWHRRNHRRQPA